MEDYSISFPGWPDGTMFDVTFTYPPPPVPGIIELIQVGDYPTEGVILAVMVLGFAGLGFAGYRTSRKAALMAV